MRTIVRPSLAARSGRGKVADCTMDEARMELPPRLRRTLELVYGVEGVTAARVWHWPGRVAVGVRPAMLSAPSELLRRVESAVAGLREPEETWEFGLLETD